HLVQGPRTNAVGERRLRGIRGFRRRPAEVEEVAHPDPAGASSSRRHFSEHTATASAPRWAATASRRSIHAPQTGSRTISCSSGPARRRRGGGPNRRWAEWRRARPTKNNRSRRTKKRATRAKQSPGSSAADLRDLLLEAVEVRDLGEAALQFLEFLLRRGAVPPVEGLEQDEVQERLPVIRVRLTRLVKHRRGLPELPEVSVDDAEIRKQAGVAGILAARPLVRVGGVLPLAPIVVRVAERLESLGILRVLLDRLLQLGECRGGPGLRRRLRRRGAGGSRASGREVARDESEQHADQERRHRGKARLPGCHWP